MERMCAYRSAMPIVPGKVQCLKDMRTAVLSRVDLLQGIQFKTSSKTIWQTVSHALRHSLAYACNNVQLYRLYDKHIPIAMNVRLLLHLNMCASYSNRLLFSLRYSLFAGRMPSTYMVCSYKIVDELDDLAVHTG